MLGLVVDLSVVPRAEPHAAEDAAQASGVDVARVDVPDQVGLALGRLAADQAVVAPAEGPVVGLHGRGRRCLLYTSPSPRDS